MSAPYASIIIPTHDRDATLPHAVRSALNQTRRDIEVVIVGDGCTPAVRSVARRLALEDSRVRFLDRPKAPLRGADNRHFAVKTALAPRIFYSDDDDLLLPHHVEVIGAELDDVDIADTPPASVTMEGRVALGLHDSGHPLQREMLVQERFKAVFDTHLAHRKEAYTRRAGAWMNARDHRVVLHMLKTFAAADDLRWKTLNRITALSFHGAPRVTMNPRARARELGEWSTRLDSRGLENALRGSGGYCTHALNLANALTTAPAPERADLLASLGLGPCSVAPENRGIVERLRAALPFKPKTGETAGKIVLSDTQRAALDAILALTSDSRPDPEGARRALDELLDPLLGPYFPVAGVLTRFARHYSPDEIHVLLHGCRERPALWLARFHLAVFRGALEDADRARVRAALEDVLPESRFFFGVSVAQGLIHAGEPHAAWEWTDLLVPLAPSSRHAVLFWKTRRALAEQIRRQPDAAVAGERIEELSESLV